MSGKIFLLFGIGGALFACARPIYEKAVDPSNSNSFQEKNSADCRLQFKKSGVCLSWAWEKRPTESEMGSLVFKTFRLNSFDQTAVQVDPEGALSVVLWMPSMGHGSSPTSVSRIDLGTFRASQVFFVMPGDWEIKFQIKNGNTIVDEIIATVRI